MLVEYYISQATTLNSFTLRDKNKLKTKKQTNKQTKLNKDKNKNKKVRLSLT